MRSHFYCLIVLLLIQAGCSTSRQAKPSYANASISQPEFFPIMPWDGYHPVKTNGTVVTAGLDSIADCNFNVGGFALPAQLGYFDKAGLGAFVVAAPGGRQWSQLSDSEIDQQIKTVAAVSASHPAAVGFSLIDEPNVKEFPALAKAVAAVKKYAPGKLAYINLFPDYATIGNPDKSQLGTESYTEYLERFVNEVHPQLISYDNYMVQYSQDQANPGVAASYYKNMLEVRRVAQEHNLPFINIAGSDIISADSTPPSPASLMLQAYTTLAAGSRGIMWFTYYEGSFPQDPVDASGRKTLVWAWLKEVNRQIVTLEPILCHLTSTGVFFSPPGVTDKLPLLPGKLVESATCATPLMFGEFQGPGDQPYVMVVNLSQEKSAKFKIKTTQPYGKINVISAMDGAPVAFNPADGYWLTAGQGVLLQLEK